MLRATPGELHKGKGSGSSGIGQMRKTRVIVLGVVCALVACCAWHVFCGLYEHLVFLCLSVDSDSPALTGVADEACNRPKAVKLAAADISVWGGRTGYYASYMLERSTLDELVRTELRAVADDTTEDLSRRAEALRILWRRTGDEAEILEFFRLVRDADASSVRSRTRAALASEFDDVDAMRLLKYPAAFALPITESEFRDIVRRTGRNGPE